MPLETFVSLTVFALVATVTPGPNNMMLLTSGVNFGLGRTVPHMFGITIGFCTLLACVGLGLGALLSTYPQIHTALKIAGVGYLLYLSWRIASARRVGEGETRTQPLTFLQAAAFQWVNPKAWMIGITGMSIYTRPELPILTVALVVLAFGLVSLPSTFAWAAFGNGMRGLLAAPKRLKWFNICMGILLALTAVPMAL